MKLRLLLILPFNGGSLIVGRHLADAVQNMPGIELDVFSMQTLYEFNEKAFRQIPDKTGRLRKISEELNLSALRRVAEFKPDLVLVIALAPVSPWFIDQAKHLGAVTAHWYIENFRYYPANPLVPKWQTVAPCYDYFFTIQKGAFFDALQSIGVSHFHYLPTGCNPRIHRKMINCPRPESIYDSDICFIGSPYPNRIALFQMLEDFNLALWGPGWDKIPGLNKFFRGTDQLVDSEQENKIINGSKIGLNIHSSLDSHTILFQSDFLNPRVFTLAACGAFQLADEPEYLSEVFDIGEEIMTYRDMDSLKYYLRYFIKHTDEREEISVKSHKRALEEHTFKNRMNDMLRIMGFV